MIQYKSFGDCGNWVNNAYSEISSGDRISVTSPYFDKEIATIPDSGKTDLDIAVSKAKSAFPNWSGTNIRDRAQIMFKFKSIIENDMEDLAALIALDNGKTIADAKGSILRGIEVVEYATSLPNVLKGESSDVSEGINCTMTHEPLELSRALLHLIFLLWCRCG